MKKTKLFVVMAAMLAVFAMLTSSYANDVSASESQTLYAPDGRTVVVDSSETETYVNVGWYTYPVTTLYSIDGRSVIVASDEAEAYKKVGWYKEPVVTMYSADGRTTVVHKSEIEAYKGVGWYSEPVVIMYAPDGRSIVVHRSEAEAYRVVGWYYEPVQTLYAPDGREIAVPSAQTAIYQNVGWYLPEDYIAFLADYTCAQSGYNKAVLLLESYTKPGGESYIEDYAKRLKLRNKLNEILYRWLTEVGSPIGVIDWHMTKADNGNPQVNVEFRNLTDKTIVAFEAEWTCYDNNGQIATDFPDLHNGVVTAWADGKELLAGESEIYTWTLKDHSLTSSISWPYPKKAAFSDGVAWYR